MKKQKRQLKLNFLLGIIVFVLGLLLLNFQPIQAQTTLPLTVAPSRQEVAIDPGGTTAVNVKFYNRGDTPVAGLLKVADFIVQDNEGTPEFLEGPTQLSPRFAAASWVQLPYDRIAIAPKDKVSIQAKITAPLDARPGGRYIAIYFEPSGKPTKIGYSKEGITPIAARIASLVYLRVSGPITEDAYVVQFSAPRFSEYGPILITTEILNRSSYHIRPKGTITLTDMFGRQIAQEKLKEVNIFPDVTRLLETKIGSKWMFGKYRAELAAAYGETGKALTAVTYFWVFPWKIASAGLLAVIIIILLISFSYRRFKRRQEKLEARLAAEEKKLEELKRKLEEKNG